MKENQLLTGKCKEDFEKWILQNLDKCESFKGKRLFYIESLDDYKFINTEHYFYNLPFSMQWGVYQDFFDAQSIRKEAHFLYKVSTGLTVFYFTERGVMEKFNTRNEARHKVIERANEIYNTATTETNSK